MRNNYVKVKVDNQHKKISTVVKNQLPTYVIQNAPELVTFIQKYYEWMESDNAPLNDSYRLLDYFFLDNTREDFLPYFLDEYMVNFPTNLNENLNIKLLIRNISDFYSSKGTPNSIKFLFKLLYNSDVKIEFPSEFILKASDGHWVKNKTIKIENVNNFALLKGRKIHGTESGATGIVDEIINGLYPTLTLTKTNGVFVESEIIETRDSLDKITSTTNRIASSIKIDNKGSGYSINKSYSISGIGIKILDIDDIGGITQVEIIDVGHNVPPQTIINNLDDKGAKLTIFGGGTYNNIGFFQGEYGKLSGQCKLQDGKTYQDFSYTLISNVPRIEYLPFLQNVHPAGMFVSSVYELVEDPLGIQTSNINEEYVIDIISQYVTLNNLQNQYPNQDLENYIDNLLNNYIYEIQTSALEEEISQEPTGVPVYTVTEDGFSLITEDGFNIIF